MTRQARTRAVQHLVQQMVHQVVSGVLADLLRETKQAQVRKNEEFQQEENAKHAKMIPEI